jgi:hypothetical protein
LLLCNFQSSTDIHVPLYRASSLKVLGLTSCTDILNEGFVEAINMFPLLEELKLSACGSICGRATYEAVGKACQNLKIIELIKDRHCRLFGPIQYSAENFDADEAHGIATMHGLRSLKIFSDASHLGTDIIYVHEQTHTNITHTHSHPMYTNRSYNYT